MQIIAFLIIRDRVDFIAVAQLGLDKRGSVLLFFNISYRIGIDETGIRAVQKDIELIAYHLHIIRVRSLVYEMRFYSYTGIRRVVIGSSQGNLLTVEHPDIGSF